jgi:tRNA dimethylallyltransferase
LKTGKPISELQSGRVGLGKDYEVKVFGLNSDRQFLYDKIDQRVGQMFNLGLINEVRRLLACKLSRTAACAIGIQELDGYFKNQYSLDEAKRIMQRNSRHYAKRQLTWFRKDKRVKWINIKKTEVFNETAKRINKFL